MHEVAEHQPQVELALEQELEQLGARQARAANGRRACGRRLHAGERGGPELGVPGEQREGARVAQLYGVLLANVLFNPISERLKTLNTKELSARDVALDGILAIQAGLSSRLLVERLETYLAPTERGQRDGAAVAEAA